MAASVRAVILALVPTFAAASFTSFTSGASCEANGAGSITTLDDCSAAAAALGLSDTTAEDDGYDGAAGRPPYCYSEYGVLLFGRGGSCRYRLCLCWLNAPPPPPHSPNYFSYTSFTSGAGCEANGAGSITTRDDCSAAGAALGFSYRRKSCGGWCPAVDDGQDGVSYDPPYCYAEHGVLKFNSAGTNTGGCKRDTCICWLNAPPPPAPPPWQLCFPSCCKHACNPSEILRREGVVCDCVGLYPKWCGPGRVYSMWWTGNVCTARKNPFVRL